MKFGETALERQIFQIIIQNIEQPKPVKSYAPDMNLADLGIHSLDLIRIMVTMEKEMGLEFDDQEMDYRKFQTIGSLVSYITEKLHNKKTI